MEDKITAEQAAAAIAADKAERERAAAEEFQALMQNHRVRVQFVQQWVNGQPGACTLTFTATE